MQTKCNRLGFIYLSRLKIKRTLRCLSYRSGNRKSFFSDIQMDRLGRHLNHRKSGFEPQKSGFFLELDGVSSIFTSMTKIKR